MIARMLLTASAIGIALATQAAATKLSGTQRTDVIASTSASCLDRSVKEEETRPYTLAVVEAYCTCFGTGIADGFSVEDLEASSNGMPPEIAKRREAIVAKCGSSTFGKAKP